jgi:hypothetical protein
MTIASRFDFGDVVLVPFPFTDQTGTKQRPAVVVSTARYNTNRRDIVIMAVTSQVQISLGFGEVMVDDWRDASAPTLWYSPKKTPAVLDPTRGAFLAPSGMRWHLLAIRRWELHSPARCCISEPER